MTFKKPLAPEATAKVNKVMLAKTMGWTYRYIEEELDVQEYLDTLEILDAVDKAHGYVRDREAWKAQGRPGRRR